MPIYEYQCKACGGVQEVMQKIDDPAPAECVACHKGPLAKMLSRTAFILKGNGWYVTDFRDKGKKASGGDSAATGSGSGTGAPAAAPAAAASSSTSEAPAAAPATPPASSAKDGGSGCGTSCGH